MKRAGILLIALSLFIFALLAHYRDALHLLTRIGGEESALASFAALGRPEVVSVDLFYPDGTRGRIYRPASGSVHARYLVLHGMHRLGIDEPRLMTLSRALAELRLEVHTPELEGLKDYRLGREEIERIQARIRGLSADTGERAELSVFAISFAAGLALLAFEDPSLHRSVRGLFLLGPYGDLERVLRFYGGSEARGPDGEAAHLRPHPYGLEIMLRDRLDEWVDPESREAVHAILTAAMSDRFFDADALSKELGGELGVELRALIRGEPNARLQRIAQGLIDARTEQLASLSLDPSRITLPDRIFILHGAEDRVIPPTESLHLEKALGPKAKVLITGAIRHAEGASASEILDRFALLHLMRGALSGRARESLSR